MLLLIILLTTCVHNRAVNMVYSLDGMNVQEELPIHWSFSCEFPKEYTAPVRAGLQYWSDVTGNNLFVEEHACGVGESSLEDHARMLVLFIDGENSDDRNILATTGVGSSLGVPRSITLRFYRTWSNYVFVNSLTSVVRHEAGHVLGFDHSDLERCIMYYQIDPTIYIVNPMPACREEIETAKNLYGKKR